MKRRTPLIRRTPMPRSGKLRPRSLKRQREDRAVNDLAEFSALFIGGLCWGCRKELATEIDHAWGRNSKLRHHRCNLGALCRECHESKVITTESMQRYKRLKKRYDRDGFDAAIWHTLRLAFCGGGMR
jgi:5-methylcytosine-specific restriction endonuclease McrA